MDNLPLWYIWARCEGVEEEVHLGGVDGHAAVHGLVLAVLREAARDPLDEERVLALTDAGYQLKTKAN